MKKFIFIILNLFIAGCAWADICAFVGSTYYCVPNITASQINWTSLANNIQNGAVNWTAISQEVQANDINWTSLSGVMNNSGINWTDQNVVTNQAVCWNGTKLSQCTSVVGAGGDCTCQ